MPDDRERVKKRLNELQGDLNYDFSTVWTNLYHNFKELRELGVNVSGMERVRVYLERRLNKAMKRMGAEADRALSRFDGERGGFLETARRLAAPDAADAEQWNTPSGYQRACLRVVNETHKGDLVNCALGLCGESGEVADLLKKHLYQGHELNRERVAEELGDVAWYLAVMAEAIGYDLETVLKMNVEKLWKRYPDGFSVERSVNREERGR